MKSFKTFIEQAKHVPKQIDKGFGLVATMPASVMTDGEVDINIIDKLIKSSDIEN